MELQRLVRGILNGCCYTRPCGGHTNTRGVSPQVLHGQPLARGCWLYFSTARALLLAGSDVAVSHVYICLSGADSWEDNGNKCHWAGTSGDILETRIKNQTQSSGMCQLM